LSVTSTLAALRPQEPESRRLATFLLLTFCAGTVSGPVSSLLPVYVESSLRQPPTFTSTLLALQLALTGLVALLGGAIADQLGQKRALILGSCGLPLAATIFLLRDFWVLAIVVVGLGITNSLSTVGGQAYLVASARPSRLGGFTAFYYLGNTLGSALGNLVFGPTADRYGFPTVGVGGLALSIVVLVVVVRYLPDAPATSPRTSVGPLVLLRSYGHLIQRREIALVGAMRFLPTGFYGTTGLLMPLLVFRLSHSITLAGFYATANLLVATAGQITIGRLSDRLGAARLARLLTAALPVLALGLALSVGTLPLLVVFGIAATSALWGISTVMPSLIRSATETEVHGRALGLVHLLWASGYLCGTLLAGALVLVSPALPFAIFAVATIPAALAAIAFGRLAPGAATDPSRFGGGQPLDGKAL
jgi:MFS family permease